MHNCGQDPTDFGTGEFVEVVGNAYGWLGLNSIERLIEEAKRAGPEAAVAGELASEEEK